MWKKKVDGMGEASCPRCRTYRRGEAQYLYPKEGTIRPQDGRTARPDPELAPQKFAKRLHKREAERTHRKSHQVVEGLMDVVNRQGGATPVLKIRARLYNLVNGPTLYTVPSKDRSLGQAQADSSRKATPQWIALGSSSPTTKKNTAQRAKEDSVLLIIPIKINGQIAHALIDSGATRCYMAPGLILAAGIHCISPNSLLELADGTKIHSHGKAPRVVVIIGQHQSKMDFTITKLLHGVELVLEMNWLQSVNPLID